MFQSHRPDFKDGEQKRDFIYVLDVVKVLFWFYQKAIESTPSVKSGIYNLGTGKARTFNDLVGEVFKNLDKKWSVNYVPTPEDIRDTYQYFTEADMQKLQSAGYTDAFMSLEEGISDYIQKYLPYSSNAQADFYGFEFPSSSFFWVLKSQNDLN